MITVTLDFDPPFVPTAVRTTAVVTAAGAAVTGVSYPIAWTAGADGKWSFAFPEAGGATGYTYTAVATINGAETEPFDGEVTVGVDEPAEASPVDPADGYRLTLTQGDDHAAGARLPRWTINGYAGPSLAGATASLRLVGIQAYTRSAGTPGAALVAAAAVTLNGSTVSVSAPLTAVQTGWLASTPPAAGGTTHKYQLVATTADGQVVTLRTGDVTVRRRVAPAVV